MDFLRSVKDSDWKQKFIEITSFNTSTRIFTDKIIEQCKELEGENITVESIYKLRSKLEKMCEDVKKINELNNVIGRRFENYLSLMNCLDSLNEIIKKYE